MITRPTLCTRQQPHVPGPPLFGADIAAGSSGTLNLPDDYVRTDAPSAGVEQLIFAPPGPLAAVPARRALALCTPRDVIARNATVPVSDSRLNAATERSEEHTSELQSLMRKSYAVFCLKKKKK